MNFFLKKILYQGLLFSFEPTIILLHHFTRGLWYIFFRSIFRYAVVHKVNIEFREFQKLGLELCLLRLDKLGDVYRFSVGQFYENLTVSRIYVNRESLIVSDLESIYRDFCKIFYVCLVYAGSITTMCSIFVYLLGLKDYLSLFLVKYIILIMISKNFITFVTSFRVVNENLTKHKISLILNFVQIFLPIPIYFYFFPFLNIELNLNTYTITNLFINMLAFTIYYVSLYFTFGKFVIPNRCGMSFTSICKDLNYLVFNVSKNIIAHVLVDLFLVLCFPALSTDIKIKALYLLNNGMRNLAGLFDGPLDWTNKIFISQYKDTKQFIISSYITVYAHMIIMVSLLSYLIKLGVLDRFMIIRFDSNAYYHLSFFIAALNVISKLWENVVIVRSKDLYPTIVLFFSSAIYMLSSYFLISIYSIDIIFSLFYGAIISSFMQYIFFMFRGFYLLSIENYQFFYEIIRYGIIIFTSYSIAKIIII